MNRAEPRHFHLSQCVTHLCRVPRATPQNSPRRGIRIPEISSPNFRQNGDKVFCRKHPTAIVHAKGARTKDTVIRRRLGLSRVPLFMNVTRTLHLIPGFYFCLARATTLKRNGMWGGVVVDRSKKRRRKGMRFKGGGERRERRGERKRERVRVRSKVRLLFMMLFPRNNRDFRKSAIALPPDPSGCFLSVLLAKLLRPFERFRTHRIFKLPLHILVLNIPYCFILSIQFFPPNINSHTRKKKRKNS